MKCKKCGASLYDDDKFCPQCGWKVVKGRRCPECGAALREGTRFCPKCGRLVDGDGESGEKVFMKDAESSDLPIDDIEQNILLETQQEIRKARTEKSGDRAAREPGERRKKTSPSGGRESGERERTPSSGRKPVPAPSPKKKAAPPPSKKRVYEEWDADDDEDDDDDEEEENNIMTIISVVVALLIFAAAAFLVFTMVRRQSEGSPDTGQEQTQEGDQAQEGEPVNEPSVPDENQGDTGQEEKPQSAVLTVISDVNVRDKPGTQGTNVIKVAKAGELYECLGTAENDQWYMIRLEDGSTGYVFKEYVSVQ